MSGRRAARFALAAAVLVAAGCGGAGEEVVYHASYPVYTDPAALTEAASLVVVGAVLSSEVREIDVAAPSDSADPELNPALGAPDEPEDSVLVFTVHQVRVTDVLQGDAEPGDVVEVSQLGGRLDGVVFREEGAPMLRSGQSYALYLQTYESGNPASLLNATQAAYLELGGGRFSALDESAPAVGAVVAELTARVTDLRTRHADRSVPDER